MLIVLLAATAAAQRGNVLFAPLEGAGLATEVTAVAARGPDVRIECAIEGQRFELEARGPGIPNGVAPGLSLRIKPLRPKIYPARPDA